MTCPRCRTEVGDASVCADCGMRFMRQVTGMIKTSAVMIATRDDDSFYSSLHEVPTSLRTRLEEATNGSNSGTILIADKGGRERILAKAALTRSEPPVVASAGKPETKPPVWAIWVGVALLVIATLIILLVWGKWPNA